jgi:hypothetical protein
MITLATIAVSLTIGLLLINFVHGQKATFEDCMNHFFNGTIDPMFPKTQTNFCNFIVEKSSIGKDEIMKLDENAVRQELYKD